MILCHASEGWHPGRLLNNPNIDQEKYWMPAFAGMTVRKHVEQS